MSVQISVSVEREKGKAGEKDPLLAFGRGRLVAMPKKATLTRRNESGEVDGVVWDESSFQRFLTTEPKKRNVSNKKLAPDPRLDPNVDPKRAKRIVANRESAARSKNKQKRHLEELKSMHRELTMKKFSIQKEIDEVQKVSLNLEDENKKLIEELDLRKKRKRDSTSSS